MDEKICKNCGKSFLPSSSRRKYCSLECRKAAWNGGRVVVEHLVRQESNAQTASGSQQTAAELAVLKERPYLKVLDFARLFGICKQTAYNMGNDGRLTIKKFNARFSLIRPSDFDAKFDAAPVYRAIPRAFDALGVHYYSLEEMIGLFRLHEKSIYRIAKNEKIPKRLHRGRVYFHRVETNEFYARWYEPRLPGTRWLSVEQAAHKYGYTLRETYSMIRAHGLVPRKEHSHRIYPENQLDDLFLSPKTQHT